MRVGVIGINHKLANLELRELLARACQRRITLIGCTQDSHTFILLTTCNRSEIYFTSDNLAETHSYLLQLLRDEVDDDFDQKVYSYFGQDCFLHLCRVTAGLDSAIVAETEIQGQVKIAYESAAGNITLPNELHYIFQKALKIGKNVRSSLRLGRGMPDLEHAVFNTGMHLFNKPENANILFVGASDVNCKILNFLKSKKIDNITICNRSIHKAQAISETYKIPVLEWSKFAEWHHYNWIIFGTKAANYLITKSDLPKQCVSQKLLIDLSVPRNVEPTIGRDPRITLLNIDQINRILRVRKHKMMTMLNQAENIVSSSVHHHAQIFQKKQHFSNSSFAV
jgi:glutamyl-tRNA reductase